MEYLGLFATIWLKFVFMLTPFFVLTIFLSMAKDYDAVKCRRLAIRVMVAIIVLCRGFFFFGKMVFRLSGITLDAFRIGVGALLFLSSVRLVQSRPEAITTRGADDEDIAVVPLAMPIVIVPAIIGAHCILGAELDTSPKHAVGKKNLRIISEITGLSLSALAAQMIFTEIGNFLS